MNCLYECSIGHWRLLPKKHSFRYNVFMLSVDVDCLADLSKSLIGFSHNRFNLFSVNDADHVNVNSEGGIRGNLTSWLDSQGIYCPLDARIQLVTFPRVLGYGFNPVSFYYITSRQGKPIVTIAEVVNTFREMKLYPIETADANGVWTRRVKKNFYVSPFSDPGSDFNFEIGPLNQIWRVGIDTYVSGARTLVSTVDGRQQSLTSVRLFYYALKFPFMSLGIIGRIHWHALLLWIKRMPYFKKSERLEVQNDVMRPHSSLTSKKS